MLLLPPIKLEPYVSFSWGCHTLSVKYIILKIIYKKYVYMKLSEITWSFITIQGYSQTKSFKWVRYNGKFCKNSLKQNITNMLRTIHGQHFLKIHNIQQHTFIVFKLHKFFLLRSTGKSSTTRSSYLICINVQNSIFYRFSFK